MDLLFKSLPEIIKAAAQSKLGILALLVVALSILAYSFFAKALLKIRVGIFVLLFAGVIGFGVAVLREAPAPASALPPAPVAASASLSKEAGMLLTGAASDPGGTILYEKFGAGVDLHANGQSFLTDKADHRAVAAWEAALQELVDRGLLVARGNRGEIYEITKRGYEAAATPSGPAPSRQ